MKVFPYVIICPVWLWFATVLLSPLGVTARSNDKSALYCSPFQPVWYFTKPNLVFTFQKKGLWSNQKLTSQRTSLHFWPPGCRNRPKITSRERWQHSHLNQEPRYHYDLWQWFQKTDLFERNSSFFRMTLCKHWKVIPQFVPLNSLHAGIVLRIGAVQVECLHIFFNESLYGKRIKMSVTSTFECTTGNGITQ